MSEFVVMPKSDYVSVCDTIREKTGTTEPIKSSELVEKTETVYQKGYEQGKSEGGTPKEEQKKNITITENGTTKVVPDEGKALSEVTVDVDVKEEDLFQYATFFNGSVFRKAIFPDDLEVNLKIKGHSSNSSIGGYLFADSNAKNVSLEAEVVPQEGFGFNHCFAYCEELLEVTFINASWLIDNGRGCFTGAKKLKKINGTLFFHSRSSLDGMFIECVSLEEIIIEGEIGSTFDIHWSPLSVTSAISIITHLVNYVGTENEFVYSVLFADSVWELLNAEGVTAPGNITWEEYVNSIGWNK